MRHGSLIECHYLLAKPLAAWYFIVLVTDPSTSQSLYATCLQHLQARRLQETEATCRQILALDPGHADALHLLGITTRQMGQSIEASIVIVERAVTINPLVPEYHCNLGLLYGDLGRSNESVAAFKHSLELRRPYASVSNHLGNALRQLGRLEEAAAAYRDAVDAKDDHFVAWSNLGNVLLDLDQLEESADASRRAIAINPEFTAAHNNLANALSKLGRPEEAIAEYRHAIALEPNYSHAHYNLALTLLLTGRFRDGWREHEWRTRLPEMLVAPFRSPRPPGTAAI